MTPSPTLPKEVEERLEDFYDTHQHSRNIVNLLKEFIAQELSSQREEMAREVEKLMVKKWERSHGYNLALSDVLSLLAKGKG